MPHQDALNSSCVPSSVYPSQSRYIGWIPPPSISTTSSSWITGPYGVPQTPLGLMFPVFPSESMFESSGSKYYYMSGGFTWYMYAWYSAEFGYMPFGVGLFSHIDVYTICGWRTHSRFECSEFTRWSWIFWVHKMILDLPTSQDDLDPNIF